MNSKLEQPTAGGPHYHEYLPSEDITPVDGLVVRGLTVETKGHRRLDAVDFSMTPGSMVAVVGTSGAGKSTFVKAIAGLEPPTAGIVVLGGIDVGSSFDLVRGQIAYVPQDNILHESLTVRETLAFAAELRLPGESAQERAARCTSIIRDLGLEERAGARVDALSGGQRKRVNVAVELLTAPALLILDEPTSGLDPASERSLLQLLRRIADSGQMIIVVTHGMGDLDIFDRVFALASGGVPVFDDAPQRLTGFLGATNTTDVFARLSELDNASSLRVPPPLSPPNERAPIVQPPTPAAQRIRTEVGAEARRQLWVLARRYARVLRSDRRGLISLLLQAPILGIVMWAVFEPKLLSSDMWFGPSPEASNVLIALVLASIYLGASNSVREIAKERPLLRREQSFGLSAFAYLTSKFVVLGAITIAQSTVLVVTATARQGGPGDPVLFPDGRLELIVLISLCGLGALSMGLLISALSRSSDRAMVVLPVVLFIQFMLAGVTFSISTPVVQQLSWLVTARWGFSGAASPMDLWTTLGCGEAWTDCDDLWQRSVSHWLTAVAMVIIVALAMFALAWWSLERCDPARVLSRNLATRSSSRLPVAPSTTYAAPRPPVISETRPTKVGHLESSIAAPSRTPRSAPRPSEPTPAVAPPPPLPAPAPARSNGRLWPWLVLMFLVGVTLVIGAAVLIRPATKSADREELVPSPPATESADQPVPSPPATESDDAGESASPLPASEHRTAADASDGFEELVDDPGVDEILGPVYLPNGDQMALLLRPGNNIPYDEGAIDLAVQSAGAWSIVQTLSGGGYPHSPVALGDLDGDEFSEIKITTHPGGNKGFDNLLRVDPDGPSLQMLAWDTQSLPLTIFGFAVESIADGVVTTSIMTCEPSCGDDPGTIVDWKLDDSAPVPTLRPIDSYDDGLIVVPSGDGSSGVPSPDAIADAMNTENDTSNYHGANITLNHTSADGWASAGVQPSPEVSGEGTFLVLEFRPDLDGWLIHDLGTGGACSDIPVPAGVDEAIGC